MDNNSQKPLKRERVIKSKLTPMNSFMKWRHSIVEIPYTHRHAERDTVLHAPDAVILALNAQHQIVIERQWRGSVNQFTLEIPAGKVDARDHGDPDHAAVRELNEEVRVKPGRLTPLFNRNACYNSPGCTTEKSYFYLATHLQPVHRDLPRDAGEFMHLHWVPFRRALNMVERGQLTDTQSVIAILAVARRLA